MRNPFKVKMFNIFFSTSLFFFGVGLYLHDFAHLAWQLGGLAEIIGFHGAYIGVVLAVIGFITVMYKYILEGEN